MEQSSALGATSAPAGYVSNTYSLFVRQGQNFGLAVEFVREVIQGQQLTSVPRANGNVAGVVNLRGDVLPVLLVDSWLELPFQNYVRAQPILILKHNDLLVGLQVDAVRHVVTVPSMETAPNPAARRLPHLGALWNPPAHPLVTLLAGERLLEVIRRDVGQLG